MSTLSGMKKPALISLPRVQDRMTFLYLERCRVSRDNNAILLEDNRGTFEVPGASISCLLLGPGTIVTHRAMELCADAGLTVVWIGEKGVRYYASGRCLNRGTKYLLMQAKAVSNQRSHLAVARKMYALRYGEDFDTSKMTMQQMRGREGSRMRHVYQECASQYKIEWTRRDYQPDSFSSGDSINQALSSANVCLYGLAHAVICALGCSPGLGFIHVGHELSFVYDIADLYKAEISIPVAFEQVANNYDSDDLPGKVRRRMREKMFEMKILERMVHDVKFLLNDGVVYNDEDDGETDLYLWDEKSGLVRNGISY